jgi:hypothetical protein
MLILHLVEIKCIGITFVVIDVGEKGGYFVLLPQHGLSESLIPYI